MLSMLANIIWQLLSHAAAETLTLARIASAPLLREPGGMLLVQRIWDRFMKLLLKKWEICNVKTPNHQCFPVMPHI